MSADKLAPLSIYFEDNLALLERLEPASFRLIYIDPPFNIRMLRWKLVSTGNATNAAHNQLRLRCNVVACADVGTHTVATLREVPTPRGCTKLPNSRNLCCANTVDIDNPTPFVNCGHICGLLH